jgi:hypothetical protein
LAITRLLRPLVRLLLNHGLTYPYLVDLLKSVYVEVADKEFPVQGKSQTDSRISLLTGLHRKDVKRLRKEGNNGDPPMPSAVSLSTQLVARWTGLPCYLDEHGHPRPLPRLMSEGGQWSFEGLVESVSKDLRSRVVLDEWLRLGVAQVDEQDRVCLNVEAFNPKQGFDEKVYHLGLNLHDHIAAGVHHLLSDEPSLTECSVCYDRLTPESVQALTKLARDKGMQALQALHHHALELQQRDATNLGAKFRINFGFYYYSASMDTCPGDGQG